VIRILLFGRLGDLRESAELEIEWDSALSSLSKLAEQVSADSRQLQRELADPQTLISVNQVLTSWEHSIKDGDEIAFLPPVTGG
jgi:molybdopterin synthase sulfur carrier subunit